MPRRLEKEFNYFYKITNLINGNFYYGIRSCNESPDEDPYMGSGKILHRAYNKYGIENFKKEVLRLLPTREDASDLERWIVSPDMVRNPKCYNVTLGGDIGYGSGIMEGLVSVIIKSTNESVVISLDEYYSNPDKYESPHKGTFTIYDKLTDSSYRITREEYDKNKDRYIVSMTLTGNGFVKVVDKDGNEIVVKYNDPRFLSGELKRPSWKPKNISKEDYSNRVSKGKKEYYKRTGAKSPEYGVRRKYVNNGEIHKKVLLDEVQSYLDKGWVLGRIESELSSRVHSEMLKSKKGKYRNMTKDNKTKLIPIDEVDKYLSNGWIIGSRTKGYKRKSSTKEKLSKLRTGRINITNGSDNKSIFPEEINDW